MTELQALTESFRTKYETFIIGCDSVELDDKWDKEANGEMDVYYENELLSVILSLIIADKKISEDEVAYLNRAFGFSYTVDELKTVYLNNADVIETYFETCFQNGYSMLKTINEKLAAAYKELFALICSIIVKSDGVVSEAEKQAIRGLTL